jgi:glycosyltransferase involved in cell wall biosynthesis
MKPLKTCLIMVGAPFDNVKARLQDRIKLFGNISDTFYLLIDKMPIIEKSSENVQIIDLKSQISPTKPIRPAWMSSVVRLINLIKIQIKMSYFLLKIRKELSIIIFATGIPFILPLIVQARIMKKKVIIMAGGTCYRVFKADNPKKYISFCIIWMLEMICYYLSTNIAAETERTVQVLGLERFRRKWLIFGALIFIDIEVFRIKNELRDRENIVGYISNLTIGKGILNLIEAEILLLRQLEDVEFLIGGDGPLYTQIQNKLKTENINNKIKFVGRISHSEVADYLNKFKLLVLPSYSEGLPGIILESMACGTPVLATGVGGVPDLIKDGETGFILKNNSPLCIAESIERALTHPNLNVISMNAKELIENEFSYKATIKRYEQILSGINEGI